MPIEDRTYFDGTPIAVEVPVAEWERMMQMAGRVAATLEYLRYCKNERGYMNHEDARLIQAMLGQPEEESNETEGEEETE